MSEPTIYGILDSIRSGNANAEWRQKMLHPIPDAEVVPNRPKWLVERVAGKVVLDVGCASGALHEALAASASRIYGIDRESTNQATSVKYDLDEVNGKDLPFWDLPIEVIVCGEVIEHLRNPGWALDRFRRCWPDAELIITVPNAFGGGSWIHRGIECVNPDHVAWYSWHTLKVLVERSGYEVLEWHWYHGRPRTAEGIIFVCRGKSDGRAEEEPTEQHLVRDG